MSTAPPLPGTIARAVSTEPGAVFSILKARALEHVRTMAGDVWSDYNESDPGVTILEQLCYALTELPYRADLPVAELLAAPDGGRLPLRRHGLPPAIAVLPCEPVTEAGWRRLVIDRVPGVANVWFTPKADAVPPVGLSGLYDVTVLAHDPHTGPHAWGREGRSDPSGHPHHDHHDDHHRHRHERHGALVARLRRCYGAHRALCEDLHRVQVLEPVETRVEASIDLEPGADASDTAARALFALGLFLAPEPCRTSLDERLAENASSTDIFSGPLMLRGFIEDAQLGPRPTRIDVNDLVQVLARTAGVLAVDGLSVDVAGHARPYVPATQRSAADTIVVPDDGVLALRPTDRHGALTLRLFQDRVRCEPDPARVRRQLALLWQRQRRTFRLRTDYVRRYTSPQAPHQDLASYDSVQNQFPHIYGIGQDGPPPNASAKRRAQVRQLQGYLMPFDQLMADYFAQLAFLPRLFSIEAGGRSTYAVQSLRPIVPHVAAVLKPGYDAGLAEISADTDPVERRRNAVLDLLLSFQGLAPPAAGDDGQCADGPRTAAQTLRTRQSLLRQAPRITRARGRGDDERRPDSPRGMAGVEMACRIALALLDETDAATPARRGHDDPVEKVIVEVVEDPADATFGRLQRPAVWPAMAHHFEPIAADALDEPPAQAAHPAPKTAMHERRSPLAGQRVAARLLACLADPAHYRLREMDDRREVYLACRDEHDGWWIVGRHATRALALALLRELVRIAREHHRRHARANVRIVEWILLRHHGEGPAFDASGYAFRISAVLAAHPDERDPAGWYERAEAIVRENTPAHVAVDCLFLDAHEMRRFERLQARWMAMRRHGPSASLAHASQELARFLAHRQHDQAMRDAASHGGPVPPQRPAHAAHPGPAAPSASTDGASIGERGVATSTRPDTASGMVADRPTPPVVPSPAAASPAPIPPGPGPNATVPPDDATRSRFAGGWWRSRWQDLFGHERQEARTAAGAVDTVTGAAPPPGPPRDVPTLTLDQTVAPAPSPVPLARAAPIPVPAPVSEPSPAHTPSPTPSVQAAPPGAIGFDTDTVLTAATARAFAAAGFVVAIRYLSRSPHHGAGDLDATEARTILAAGLALMAVQHAPPSGWIPHATLGGQYGEAAAINALAAGLPAGVSVWLDLEGVVRGAPAQDVIDYCNHWLAAVAAAGYVPGVYVGANCGLGGEQLGEALHCHHFWRSGSRVPSATGAGYCLVQTIDSGDLLHGVAYDRDVVQAGSQGQTPFWLAPGTGAPAAPPHAPARHGPHVSTSAATSASPPPSTGRPPAADPSSANPGA